MNPADSQQSFAISVAIINFNGRSTLPETIKSVLAQDVKPDDIRLLDNNSTDGSAEYVAASFPEVLVTRLSFNRGPNPARNEGLRLARHDLVLVMDNDIVLAPDYISRLANVFTKNPAVGAVTGQIRFHDRPTEVQYNGTDIHYAGEIMLNRRESLEPIRVGCVSAGAVLLDRRWVYEVGGFDNDFFIGWEDGDLTYRLSLAGFPCYVVSSAVCYHLRRERGRKWVRYQTRNRWWFIFKNYDRRTIILALPAILLLQFCAFLFLSFKGEGAAFLRGTFEAIKGIRLMADKRKTVQDLRRNADACLLRGERIDLPGKLNNSIPGRMLSLLFRFYWFLIFPFLKGRSNCQKH